MTKSDRSFAGSIPEIYDSFLVPLIFEEYADDLAKRAADLQPESVLETAAGSGVVTRALEKKLVDTARIIATDLNQPMLSRAASSQGTSSKVEWQAAKDPAIAYCQGTPLRNEIEERDATQLEAATAHAGREIQKRFGMENVTGKIQGHVIAAKRG